MSSRSSSCADLRRQRSLCGEPREGAAGHQLPGRLGDHVVVGRRTAAGERGEVLLVPADLPQGERVPLEQVGHARPVVEQAPDPGQADQADAELDAAGPVHAGQERVLPPPGAEMVGDPAGVPLVTGEEPGGGQQREVLQPGDLPDLLDVADLLLPSGDRSGRRSGPDRTGGPSPGRGTSRAGPYRSATTPRTSHSPLEQPLRAGQDGRPGLAGNPRGGARRQDGGEPAVAARRRGVGRESVPGSPAGRTTPPGAPGHACAMATSAGDIRRAGGAYQPSRDDVALTPAPASRSAGSRRRRSVALVVAIRDSSGIGIGAPARPASTKPRQLGSAGPCPGRPATAWCCCPRPLQTVAFLKLSRRALRPPAAASRRLLREARIAARDVGDDTARAVLEPHGDLHVVLLRTLDGVDLLGQAARPTSSACR